MTYHARAFKAQVAKRKEHTKPEYTIAHSALGKLASLYGAIDALQTLHADRNPLETQAVQEKRIQQAVKKLETTAKEVGKQAENIIGDGIARLQGELDTKVKLKPNEYAAELRAQARTLDYDGKLKLLTELADANDGPMLAALIKAPSVLTGIPAEVSNRFTEHVYAKHAPEEWEELKDLLTLVTERLDIVNTALTAAKAYSDPVRLAEITAQEEAALRAQAHFDQMSGSAP